MLFLLLTTSRAHALGLGSSLALAPGGGAGAFTPTFDLVFDSLVLQIRATETLNAAFNNELFLGANLYANAAEKPIAGGFSGVVQPGGGLQLYGDPTVIVVSGQCRLGAQAVDQAGFGLYVVPEIGLVESSGDVNLYAGGALQVSVWFPL
jgi:hypothetical protein